MELMEPWKKYVPIEMPNRAAWLPYSLYIPIQTLGLPQVRYSSNFFHLQVILMRSLATVVELSVLSVVAPNQAVAPLLLAFVIGFCHWLLVG